MSTSVLELSREVLTITSPTGMQLDMLPLGARITKLSVPCSNSAQDARVNVVLGYDSASAYSLDTMYMGAVTGRYTNRIANGQFVIGDKRYLLPCNDGSHHLHGGPGGFHNRLWTVLAHEEDRLRLGLVSEDGDQGYPGKLQVQVTYDLSEEGCLNFIWEATASEDTVVSLTQHSYFNLAGSGDIAGHYLRIPMEHYTPVDAALIPTGEIAMVADTPFNFMRWQQLAPLLRDLPEVFEAIGGLDHNWVRPQQGGFLPSAQLYSPVTELLLEVSSTLPALQCYTGNELGKTPVHASHEGICLETQHYPDAPNRSAFPSPILMAGESVQHKTRYRFAQVAAGDIENLTEA